jgi:hypothetical protein
VCNRVYRQSGQAESRCWLQPQPNWQVKADSDNCRCTCCCCCRDTVGCSSWRLPECSCCCKVCLLRSAQASSCEPAAQGAACTRNQAACLGLKLFGCLMPLCSFNCACPVWHHDSYFFGVSTCILYSDRLTGCWHSCPLRLVCLIKLVHCSWPAASSYNCTCILWLFLLTACRPSVGLEPD